MNNRGSGCVNEGNPWHCCACLCMCVCMFTLTRTSDRFARSGNGCAVRGHMQKQDHARERDQLFAKKETELRKLITEGVDV